MDTKKSMMNKKPKLVDFTSDNEHVDEKICKLYIPMEDRYASVLLHGEDAEHLEHMLNRIVHDFGIKTDSALIYITFRMDGEWNEEACREYMRKEMAAFEHDPDTYISELEDYMFKLRDALLFLQESHSGEA